MTFQSHIIIMDATTSYMTTPRPDMYGKTVSLLLSILMYVYLIKSVLRGHLKETQLVVASDS